MTAYLTGDPAVPVTTQVDTVTATVASRRAGSPWPWRLLRLVSVAVAIGLWQVLTAGKVRLLLRFDTLPTVTEIVHAPVTTTDHQAGDQTQLDAECDSWQQAFSNPQYVVANVTAAVSGGASWSDTDGRIAVDMASYPVWSGDQDPFQAECASATIHIPGTARAVSPVAGGKPDSDGGWAVFRYGFSTAVPGQATPAPSGIVFSKCRVQLGTAAASSIFASTWTTHPETDGGAACRAVPALTRPSRMGIYAPPVGPAVRLEVIWGADAVRRTTWDSAA